MELWQAVQWDKELKLEKVHFEMDAKVVADAVNKDNGAIDWRPHHTILDIKNLFIVFTSLKLSYVPKERNKVADILYKLARTDGITNSWICDSIQAISHQLPIDSSFVLA